MSVKTGYLITVIFKGQEIKAAPFTNLYIHSFQMRMSVKRESMTVLKNRWSARISSARTSASVGLGISEGPTEKAA